MSAQPYTGTEKVVFAIDCGTTMTAIAYAHLCPGSETRIVLVNRWPAQEDALGNCKVPTVVRYDEDGNAISFGTEAISEDDDHDGLAYWFKLWLHPDDMREDNNLHVPPLPRNVTIQKVYRDFLRFAFRHAQNEFRERNVDGSELWARLSSSFEIIYAIPNGWSGRQQSFVRDALVAAEILPQNFQQDRLAFLSEAEASVHFALEYMNLPQRLNMGDTLAVLDAGGSTVDTTLYRCSKVSPKLMLSEVTSSECVQAGSVYVDIAFGTYIRQLLEGSRFADDPFYINKILQTFESKTKRRFAGHEEDVIIPFGPRSVNDAARGIERGRLSVPTEEMRKTFEKPVSSIVTSVARLLERVQVSCKTFLLVGGFAESQFLRDMLRIGLVNYDINLVTCEEPTKKAAAEGACLWRIKQYVTARAARYTYGMRSNHQFDEIDPNHRERRSKIYVDPAGNVMLPGFFDALVKKNEVVDNSTCSTQEYCRRSKSRPVDLDDFVVEMYATNDEKPGQWATTPEGSLIPGLHQACILRANLSGLTTAFTERHNLMTGRRYFQVDFKVEIYFGQTTLCAAIVWEEQGETKRGPVTIIADSVV